MEILSEDDETLISATLEDPVFSSLKVSVPDLQLMSIDDIKTPTTTTISQLSWQFSSLPLPKALWERVFCFLNDRPQDLKLLAASCRLWCDICKSNCPALFLLFRSSLLKVLLLIFLTSFQRSNKYLAFHHIYEAFPWMLTFEVSDALLALNAHLPKYFVERIFRDQQHLQSLARPQRLPEGTVEFLVAQGYKLYKKELHLGLPGDDDESTPTPFTHHESLFSDEEEFPADDFLGGPDDADQLRESELFPVFGKAMTRNLISPRNGNDASDFESCFLGIPNVTRIRFLIEKHSFVPALACPVGSLAWHDHWGRIVALLSVDAELAVFLGRNSGVDWKTVNEAVVCRLLRDSATTIESFKAVLALGWFSVTKESIVEILVSKDFPLSTNAKSEGGAIPALDILRATNDTGFIIDAVETALSKLFREGVPRSLREADFLMTEFATSEDVVANALLVSPYSVKCKRKSSPYRVPTMTVFSEAMADAAVVYNRANGSENDESSDTNYFGVFTSKDRDDLMYGGGIRDCLWQLVIGRYGADHPFVQACLHDLLVGGVVPLANIRRSTLINFSIEERVKSPNLRLSTISGTSFSSSRSGSNVYPSVTQGRATPPPPRTNSSSVIFAHQTHQGSNPLMTDHIVSLVEEDDEDEDLRDMLSRDSLEALLEAGVPFEPVMFGPLSRSIFGTRHVHARHLDFLARIERGLLGLDKLGKEPSEPTSPVLSRSQHMFDAGSSIDKKRWSKVRWVAVFRRMVLDDKEWKEKVRPAPPLPEIHHQEPDSPTSPHSPGLQFHSPGQTSRAPLQISASVTTHSKTWIETISESMGITDPNEKKYAEIKRFYHCLDDLVTLLSAPPAVLNSVLFAARMQHQNQVAAAQSKQPTANPTRIAPPPVGPFSRWLAELDNLIGAPALQPMPGGAGHQISWSDWFKGISDSAAGAAGSLADAWGSGSVSGTEFVDKESGVSVTLDRKVRQTNSAKRKSKRMSIFG
ncbi:hypothetical protein HK096_003191 [Nowakowskiella sp. JEL0078]|nr:hypothetical protein HK096_003191 [Nowakowskiella sp. JEL0078]